MTAIAVFVDRLTKMVHFIPCRKEITAQQYARLFIEHVFKLHGLPEVIISYWNPKFLSKFWDELFAHLGTDLQFSMAFHPQTDGQSEVTNRVMENILKLWLGLVCEHFTYSVQYCGRWGPLYDCIVLGPHLGNVARGICLILQ